MRICIGCDNIVRNPVHFLARTPTESQWPYPRLVICQECNDNKQKARNIANDSQERGRIYSEHQFIGEGNT